MAPNRVNIQFTPLYGVQSNHKAVSYLLTIDSFNILLDCGWNSAFSPEYLTNLAKVAPSIHLVLLSQPDIAHLGALPYAVAKLGLDAPIFSTLPVWRMGQMFMYDTFLSLDAQSSFSLFDLDHVDAAFEISPQADGKRRFRLLKYQQHFPLDFLQGGSEIIITPHAAGHMLGGTVWNIKKNTESIVYAVDFNHRRERHLNPTTLASFDRPSHLIIGAGRAATPTELKKTSDIVSKVKNIVSRGGNVLIPVDTAGRIIELAVHLHDAWGNDRNLTQIPLIILHELSTRTFEFARSMIEWMSDEVVRRFDVSRENLFIFKHVKLYQSLRALDALTTPVVVLASSISMEMGFSRQLFARWCHDPKNGIVLTDTPEPETLYSRLFQHCLNPQQNKEAPAFDLILKRKEFLQGEELERWREEERARIARERAEEKRKEDEARAAQEAASKGKDAIMNDTVDKPEGTASTGPAEDQVEKSSSLTPQDLFKDPEQYDEYMLGQLKRLGAISENSINVFPFVEKETSSWDHYGQVLDTTRFMIGEDPGEGAPARPSDVAGGDIENGDAMEDADENIPTKYVTETLSVVVNCELSYFDMAGLTDGDSLKRIVKEVEPRQVTIVAGTIEETRHFSSYLRSTLVGASKGKLPGQKNVPGSYALVVSPTEMETVDITSHASVIEMQLDEPLALSLDWNQVGSAGIAFVDGTISEKALKSGKPLLTMGQLSPPRISDAMEIENQGQDMEYRKTPSTSAGHPTVFVGTVMLNRMKDVVIQAGMKAEFAGGALCVENPETGVVVLLKKVATQQVVIEGAFSEEYLNVRDLLYKEFVIP